MALSHDVRRAPRSRSASSRSSSATRRSASCSSTTTRSPACAGLSTSFEEASADLGADTFQTFRYVTFPALRSALIAGGLLAFALSFDEVIVTIFMAGGRQDAADLDLPELPPREPGPAGQRRGAGGDPAVGHPGLHRHPAQRRRRRRARLTRLTISCLRTSLRRPTARTVKIGRDGDDAIEESAHRAPPPADGRMTRRPTLPSSARSETAARVSAGDAYLRLIRVRRRPASMAFGSL